jgi:hypothetical protein
MVGCGQTLTFLNWRLTARFLECFDRSGGLQPAIFLALIMVLPLIHQTAGTEGKT